MKSIDRIFQLEPEDPRFNAIIYNLILPMMFRSGGQWYTVGVWDHNMGGLFICVKKSEALSYSLYPGQIVSGSGTIKGRTWNTLSPITHKPLSTYINHHNCQNRKVWWVAYENY